MNPAYEIGSQIVLLMQVYLFILAIFNNNTHTHTNTHTFACTGKFIQMEARENVRENNNSLISLAYALSIRRLLPAMHGINKCAWPASVCACVCVCGRVTVLIRRECLFIIYKTKRSKQKQMFGWFVRSSIYVTFPSIPVPSSSSKPEWCRNDRNYL